MQRHAKCEVLYKGELATHPDYIEATSTVCSGDLISDALPCVKATHYQECSGEHQVLSMTPKCDTCDDIHNGEYGSGRFCNARCARQFSSRINREETNRKISNSLIGKPRSEETKAHQRKIAPTLRGFTDDDRRMSRLKSQADNKHKILSAPFDNLSYNHKKKRVLIEQNFKCAGCENSHWRSRPICLEIEHRDGNTNNDKRDNLEYLCPNCHSQTRTWRRAKSSKYTVSDETILEHIRKSRTILEVQQKCGCGAKNNNLGFRIWKLAHQHNLQLIDQFDMIDNENAEVV